MTKWVVLWSIFLGSTVASATGYEMSQNDLVLARSDAREEADLVAQQDVARWAGPMFFATVASVLLSAGALGGLFTSLWQTRRAIRDSRELGEAAVRAYVEAASVTFSGDGDAMLIKFVNMGQTPVSSFRAAIELSQVPEKTISGNIKLLGSVPMKSFDGIGCGSQPEREVRVEPRKGVETIRVFTGNTPPKGEVCLLNGRIDYRDVFGLTWTTGFAFFSRGGKFLEPFHTLPTYRLSSEVDASIAGRDE